MEEDIKYLKLMIEDEDFKKLGFVYAEQAIKNLIETNKKMDKMLRLQLEENK